MLPGYNIYIILLFRWQHAIYQLGGFDDLVNAVLVGGDVMYSKSP